MNTIDQKTKKQTRHLDAVVVGAGQAGLAAAYHLKRQGANVLVVDGNARTGDNWRSHWDSLRLYSPAVHDDLPGLPFPADPHSFPTRDEVADYLETYAATFDLPVRHSSPVRRLSRENDAFVVECPDVRYTADNVIVATGTFGRSPKIPAFGADLDPQIVQLHSSEYRNPDQLRPGRVLVVGASHSGADIAIEVVRSHETVLCGRDTGALPVRPGTRRFRLVFPLVWQMWGLVQTIRTPIGRRMKAQVRAHGAPLLRVTSADLTAAGVERVTERMIGAQGGNPVVGTQQLPGIANVIWCTGSRRDDSWIDLPVIGDDGWPREERGVVPTMPGLYFTGVAFQYSFRSMLIGGAGADAEYVVNHLLSRRSERDALPAPAA
ncbi:flavin-containing monooxygenase [Paramicrobacterium fandaimingii]|uniref:flavin-containing monooxygenase n=1 Tax=Paramicrobacterium fandaimingii TaxID=2708079 RepID=UPI001423C59D|nr:NAD(P)/FAD-dependent oxidoreductase [Microbacterium fandaimingii]